MQRSLLLSFILFVVCCKLISQSGCTDPLANNFDPTAIFNDGSCIYPNTAISPIISFNLDARLNETSGLISWNSKLWTNNDNSDINIYSIYPDSSMIIDSIELSGISNIDLEEISQDSNYIYVGDFGNNANGNRTNLKIFRISKSDLLQNIITVDTIFFSYSDQVIFTGTGANNTDFDCESFIVTIDSIFLFTKQWITQKTAKYSLPKLPGTYTAQLSGTLDVQGLITGATYLNDKSLLVLSGYTTTVQPFIYLLYDFDGTDFFTANKRKINLNLGFHQIEGICSEDGINYFLTNERLSYLFISVEPKLHKIDLSNFLSDYLNPPIVNTEKINDNECYFYPNPTQGNLNFNKLAVSEIMVTNLSIGRVDIFEVGEKQSFDLSFLLEGVYQISLLDEYHNIICSGKIVRNAKS